MIHAGQDRKVVNLQRRSNCNKTVQFSPFVCLRYCFYTAQRQQQQDVDTTLSALWLSMDELAYMKIHARTLAKLHHRMRSLLCKHGTQASSAIKDTSPLFTSNTTVAKTVDIGDVSRYEIEGESIRGMECWGRKRREIKHEAILAVLIEQQEQCDKFFYSYHNDTAFDDTAFDEPGKSTTVKIDTSKLAKLYRAKTQEALINAKRLAEEDAKVAMTILDEDLQETS